MDAAGHDANVISMGFGSSASSEFERDATLSAYSLDCILVAASGNRADFPRYVQLELVALGVNILSTVPWNDYANDSGTSMATPHVAGVAALLKSRAERWPEEPLATEPWCHPNNSQIRKILRLTAEDIGTTIFEELGAIVLNLNRRKPYFI